jgi:beta-phosphoglucomutase-like phosphatase (HAD superfamily)
MVDAVLLEWEGVLADTSAARRDALLVALREEGVHFDAAHFADCCEGFDAGSAARAALSLSGRRDPVLADLVTMRARRAFAERLGKGLTLHPGAKGFAERLAVGTRTAIVTSASRSETDFILRLAGLEAAIASIVTSDDVAGEMPSATAYVRAVEHLARVRPVRTGRVIAVVSSARAIRAVRQAGMRAVAVHVPAHVAVEADGVVSSLPSITLEDVARAAGIETVEKRP